MVTLLNKQRTDGLECVPCVDVIGVSLQVALELFVYLGPCLLGEFAGGSDLGDISTGLAVVSKSMGVKAGDVVRVGGVLAQELKILLEVFTEISAKCVETIQDLDGGSECRAHAVSDLLELVDVHDKADELPGLESPGVDLLADMPVVGPVVPELGVDSLGALVVGTATAGVAQLHMLLLAPEPGLRDRDSQVLVPSSRVSCLVVPVGADVASSVAPRLD